MNVDTDLCITLNRVEAEQLRTALHIATRLTAHAPHGLSQPLWSEAFSKLHSAMRNDVEILPGAVDFSDDILKALKTAEHPDDLLLRLLTRA